MVAVVRQQGSVAELHALDPFAAVSDGSTIEPQVWWCDPTDSALVLGSRQSLEVVDVEAAAAAGLNVARRRSGGGAVVVRREACAWVDVIVPHGMAPDDIRGAMVWIGEHWLEALRPLLSPSDVGDHLDVQHSTYSISTYIGEACSTRHGPNSCASPASVRARCCSVGANWSG